MNGRRRKKYWFHRKTRTTAGHEGTGREQIREEKWRAVSKNMARDKEKVVNS